MGPVSKKPARRFAKWSGQFQRSARTVPMPKDVRDVLTQEIVDDMQTALDQFVRWWRG